MYLLLASLALGADPTTEHLDLKTDTGTLHATLDLPAGKESWPVVLLHAGSGPTDQDGNSAFTKSDNLKMVGTALAAKGIACLRIDKRGVGASARAIVKEDDLRITSYSDDVTAWVKKIRTDKRFTKVGFIGHSEGALIGTVAGPDAKFDAFVALCGPGRKLSDVLREQLKPKLPKELAEKNEAILKKLEANETETDVPKELLALYRPSVQPYLSSVFAVDPVKALAKLQCPVLVLSGSTDIQVSEGDAKALAAVKGSKAVRIDNMNHVLKEVEGTAQLVQLKSYTDPKLPLHPKLMPALVGFFETAFAK